MIVKTNKIDKYTLMWLHPNGAMMNFTVDAVSKEHALSKALGDPILNIYLIDYMSQYGYEVNVDHFLWNINGKLG
jgi:hypothetical protein